MLERLRLQTGFQKHVLPESIMLNDRVALLGVKGCLVWGFSGNHSDGTVDTAALAHTPTPKQGGRHFGLCRPSQKP